MLAFVRVFLILAAALVAAALLTYPAWLAVSLISEQPVHRVMHRVAMLMALIGLVWFVRREGLTHRRALGFAAPRPLFLRQVLQAFVAGLLLLSPLILVLFALDLRVPKTASEISQALLPLVAGALATGFTVAFIEEVFFRGVLQSAVERESGRLAALLLPSALYASLHFLGGRLRLPTEEIDWSVGFTVLAKLFEKYAEPLALVDSFFALFAVGLLLAVVRARTGSIAASIGLHAAWVMLISVTRARSVDNVNDEQGWLTGAYDGVIGWGSLCWTAVIIVAFVWFANRRARVPNAHAQGVQRHASGLSDGAPS